MSRSIKAEDLKPGMVILSTLNVPKRGYAGEVRSVKIGRKKVTVTWGEKGKWQTYRDDYILVADPDELDPEDDYDEADFDEEDIDDDGYEENDVFFNRPAPLYTRTHSDKWMIALVPPYDRDDPWMKWGLYRGGNRPLVTSKDWDRLWKLAYLADVLMDSDPMFRNQYGAAVASMVMFFSDFDKIHRLHEEGRWFVFDRRNDRWSAHTILPV